MTELFLRVLNISLSAGWLILAVLVGRVVLKKAPRWVSVLLWGLVAVRLLCPLSIESQWSLVPSARVVSPSLLVEEPKVTTGFPGLDKAINPVLEETTVQTDTEKSGTLIKVVAKIASRVWVVGAVVMLGYTTISYLFLHRKLATAVRYRDNIFQGEGVDSPFVLGILRPRIYLPFSMKEGVLAYVVAHEKAHIRRRDHWWKPLGFALLTVYWFHPLLWLSYVLFCRDIELACDERVIRNLGANQRADYTEALVACSMKGHGIAACPLAFGEIGVKERVKSVMHYKKPTFWLILLAVGICVVVAVCFLTDPVDDAPDLSFLNYKNAGSLVLDAGEIMAIYCPPSEDGSSSIQVGATDGAALAKQLDRWDWKACKAPRDSLPSPGSVEFIIEEEYRITVHQRKSGSFRQYAVVKHGDEERYYATDKSDYPDAVSLVHAPALQKKDTGIVATSGKGEVPVVVFPLDVPLSEIKESVYWLSIAPEPEETVPFTIFCDGWEQQGWYAVYDAQTMECLDFMRPSGLSPQTYLFQNAEYGRDYIVTLRTDVGDLLCFGARIGDDS